MLVTPKCTCDVEAKNLLRYDSAVNKTGWKLVLLQNISNLLNVAVEASPGVVDFECHVHQQLYKTQFVRER